MFGSDKMEIFKSFIFFITLTYNGAVFAADSFTPAGFADPTSLAESIKFPALRGNFKQVIMCEALVLSSGGHSDGYCYTEKDSITSDLPFRNAVLKGFRDSKTTPAKVNERSKTVWFQFAVLFVQRNKQQFIRVFPNHTYDVSKYGENYSAAQRLINFKNIDYLVCGANAQGLIRSVVDSEGKTRNADFLSGVASPACKKRLLKSFKKASYIPAISNGKAVDSDHLEMFYNIGDVNHIRIKGLQDRRKNEMGR